MGTILVREMPNRGGVGRRGGCGTWAWRRDSAVPSSRRGRAAPAVTVVIPVGKVDQLLDNQLRAVLAQTTSFPFEVVVSPTTPTARHASPWPDRQALRRPTPAGGVVGRPPERRPRAQRRGPQLRRRRARILRRGRQGPRPVGSRPWCGRCETGWPSAVTSTRSGSRYPATKDGDRRRRPAASRRSSACSTWSRPTWRSAAATSNPWAASTRHCCVARTSRSDGSCRAEAWSSCTPRTRSSTTAIATASAASCCSAIGTAAAWRSCFARHPMPGTGRDPGEAAVGLDIVPPQSAGR